MALAGPPRQPTTLRIQNSRSKTLAERARDTVNESLLRERNFAPLDEYIGHGVSNEYEINNSGAWTPFQRTRNYQLPEALFEQVNQAQLSTQMGLFAEINHAWACIDNALYLWDYTVPNPQLIGYEDQPHEVTAVHLAVPRKGVFLPSITRLIVMATRGDIVLLGLGKESTPNGKKVLQLFETGMSISVRGLSVKVIGSSSKTGRIFFGGETENHVYELQYQNEERWFLGRCVKKNHTYGWSASFAPGFGFRQRPPEFVKQLLVDDSRNLVYTLSSESAIRALHMDTDTTLKETLNYPSQSIYSMIGHYIAENEALNSKHRITSISTISADESSKFHLVAVTENGYRIYISAISTGYWTASTSSKPPTNLAANTVRFPPSGIPNSSQSNLPPGQNMQLQRIGQAPQTSRLPTRAATRYAPGYFFCLEPKSRRIFISSPDPGLIPRRQGEGQPHPSRENAMWVTLDAEAESVDVCNVYQPPIRHPQGFGNELAIQFDKPAVEIAVLTTTGIYIFHRRTLVDGFAALYREGGGDEGRQGAIRKLMSIYGREETLATALAVACGQGTEFTPDSGLGQIRDPEVLAFAKGVFINHGGKPSINENMEQPANPLDTVRASPRHEAIATFISRIVRSTWKNLVAQEARTPTGGYSVVSSLPVEKLRIVQQNLSSLSQFFSSNRNSIDGLRGPDENRAAATRQDDLALQGENRALHSLVQLVEKAIEGIAFVLLLFEERVEDLVRLLAEPMRPMFFQLTYESLFTDENGLKVAKELVKAIVNRSIARGSNVETVAETLRRRCGQFCSPEDVVTFKAQELLKRATEAGLDSEYGRNLLNESLSLFTQVAKTLQWEYLESAIKQYTALQFYAGAIQLVLKVADTSDPTDEAGSLLRDNMPNDETRQKFYDYRQRCYNLIHDVVNAVDQSSKDSVSSPRARSSKVAQRQREAYNVIAESTDELFLSNLYDWYLDQGWTDRLLATDSNYIVQYLERKAQFDHTHADLLWRYYNQKQLYLESSLIQLELAKSSFDLPLARRILYLSQAKTNIQLNKRAREKDRRQRLLKEITDHLDIGNLQDDLLQRFRSDERFEDDNRNMVLGELDGPIKTVSELYNKFIQEAEYHDLAIIAFSLADYRDPTDITHTWLALLQSTWNHSSFPSDATSLSSSNIFASSQLQPQSNVNGASGPNAPPSPWSSIILTLQSLYPRLSSAPIYFPLPTILPELLRLSSSTSTLPPPSPQPPRHWTIDLFLSSLGPPIPHQTLFSVLESTYYDLGTLTLTTNSPSTAHRRLLTSSIVYLVGKWFDASTARMHRGGVSAEDVVMGGPEQWERVETLLIAVVEENAGRNTTPLLSREEEGVVRRVREGVGRILG